MSVFSSTSISEPIACLPEKICELNLKSKIQRSYEDAGRASRGQGIRHATGPAGGDRVRPCQLCVPWSGDGRAAGRQFQDRAG